MGRDNDHGAKNGRREAGETLSDDMRAALLALSYDDALEALENEDPAAVTMATEYILDYSEKVGELLRQGSDYLELLTPSASTPALERIAMELVLETAEEELDAEE